jgi:phosphonate transport system substrate-binding protein
MKNFISIRILLGACCWRGIAVLALVLGTGCRSKTALDANGVPYRLVVAVYEGDNPGETTKILDEVRPYLEKKIGIPVEFQKSTDYTTVIEAMTTGKVHMAYLSPFSYIIATKKQKLVPMVTSGMNGKPSTYRSLIFTNPHTGIHSIDDLKARAKDLTLCFADPASTSGHLIPMAYLTTMGLDPKTAFKQTMFAGSHYASVLSVKSGKVDIGCSSELSMSKMVREGLVKESELVVLWTSDPIVESPICMRPEVNAGFREKVCQAYLDMPKDAPTVFHDYMARYFGNAADSMSYMRVNDTLYDPLRKIAGSLEDLSPTKK